MADQTHARAAEATLTHLRAQDDSKPDWNLLAEALFVVSCLPSGVDHELVRQGFRDFLTKRPYQLWPRLSFLPREYASLFWEELVKVNDPHADFLRAAVGSELSDRGFARLKRAARALAKIERYARSALDRTACEGVRFISGDPDLVEAAQKTLLHSKTIENSTGVLAYWLPVILAHRQCAAVASPFGHHFLPQCSSSSSTNNETCFGRTARP